MITAWNPQHPNSHLNGFEFNQGRLHVPATGRYYVYFHMYFNARPHDSANRVVVYAGDRIILLIHKDMKVNEEETGSAGGVFLLTAGETIYVKVVGYPTKLWVGPSHCYFGAYMI